LLIGKEKGKVGQRIIGAGARGFAGSRRKKSAVEKGWQG
jgi:hypothetical protein